MIFEKIIELLRNYTKADIAKISNETKLREELGIKSVDIVNLLVNIEEEFGIQIDMSKLNTSSFLTVKSVCSLIESLKGGI